MRAVVSLKSILNLTVRRNTIVLLNPEDTINILLPSWILWMFPSDPDAVSFIVNTLKTRSMVIVFDKEK